MVKILKIDAKETYAIRHEVLRPGRPLEERIFAGDDEYTTFHLGVYEEENLVGIASFVVDENRFFTGSQYRLRGMAVLPAYRGKDYGKKLIAEGEKILRERGVTVLWFNAREIAVGFYEKLDFKIVGEPFEIPTVGLHYVMYKKLKQKSG
ncbi:MAG: GNAT family N-acetyltransferase [Leeuwenhoekiella sp.]